jgi:catechol 2,3-dioxygenase-like lactoylglutathione lyase family enzyme
VHVHLTASNLEASKAFYCRLFGSAPIKERADYVKFLPEVGPLNLALSQSSAGAHGPMAAHFGIQVESSEIVRRELERVRKAGLAVREEMSHTCRYANQDKFWVVDPDGVEWEIYHLNYDTQEKNGQAASCCAS